jgi:RimJ/RimL family protein N-acetyltransferase
MKGLVIGEKQWVAAWVAERLGRSVEDWGRFSAIGLWEDDGLIAGFVFNHFNPPDIAIHLAAVPGSNWCTKSVWAVVFDYVFNQLGCSRATGSIRGRNQKARKLAERLGGVLEGTLRKASPDGDDVVLYGLLKEDCKWIKAEFLKRSGKELPILL